DVQQPTEHAQRVVGLLRLDEGEPYLLSLAKKAVAFFKISTSMRRRSLSLRSFASSHSSSVVKPVFSSPLTMSSHAPSTFGRPPTSRATGLSFLPLWWSSSTASRLNSFVNFLRAMGPP